MFVQEPQFVSRPNSTAEDDGVILAQGVDGTKNKGKMQSSAVSKWDLIIHFFTNVKMNNPLCIRESVFILVVIQFLWIE